MGTCECGCGRNVSKRFVRGHNKRSRKRILTPDDYRVEDRGHVTACWIVSRWKPDDSRGYTRIRSEGRRVGAHVLMWLQQGRTIPIGMQLDHLCRQPSCINPNHLEPVTPLENTRRGLSAKLSREQVLLIRELRHRGMKHEEIAAVVGISRGSVSNVLRGVHWSDISY